MENRIVNLLIILLIALSAAAIYFATTELDEKEEQAKSSLGEMVVLNGDTFTVTDYSLFKNTLMLSNGSEISPALLEKLKVVDKDSTPVYKVFPTDLAPH